MTLLQIRGVLTTTRHDLMLSGVQFVFMLSPQNNVFFFVNFLAATTFATTVDFLNIGRRRCCCWCRWVHATCCCSGERRLRLRLFVAAEQPRIDLRHLLRSSSSSSRQYICSESTQDLPNLDRSLQLIFPHHWHQFRYVWLPASVEQPTTCRGWDRGCCYCWLTWL